MRTAPNVSRRGFTLLEVCAGSNPVNNFIDPGRYVKVANPTKTAEIIADRKNERLIACIAERSVERSRVINTPMIAVTIPIAGTING